VSVSGASGCGWPVGYPILIIDDHELFSTSLTMALRGRGFDAHQIPVTRIKEFLSRSSDGPIGLVPCWTCTCSETPWVTGERRGPGGFPARAGLKVLVFSGSVDKPGVAAAIASGAIGSVPKSSSFDG
jgi:two-component system nitrate/nitrite response regulator NarL